MVEAAGTPIILPGLDSLIVCVQVETFFLAFITLSCTAS
jgi:hypothetical protein